MPKYDFNVLGKAAAELIEKERYQDALKIYFFMIDGDSTLEAGFYGERIGYCYEMMGELNAAKYWYGRAVEENPAVDFYRNARERLSNIGIDDLIDAKLYIKSY